MSPAQKQAALETATAAIARLLADAPDYGSIGAEFHFKAGVLIRTTTRTEKTKLVEDVMKELSARYRG